MDVVLYNECGLELAREYAETQDDILGIIAGWILNVGDTISFEEA